MKEKRTKCDQWIKPWLERRNQQERSSESVVEIRFFRKLRKIHRKMSVQKPVILLKVTPAKIFSREF